MTGCRKSPAISDGRGSSRRAGSAQLVSKLHFCPVLLVLLMLVLSDVEWYPFVLGLCLSGAGMFFKFCFFSVTFSPVHLHNYEVCSALLQFVFYWKLFCKHILLMCCYVIAVEAHFIVYVFHVLYISFSMYKCLSCIQAFWTESHDQ